MCNSSPGYLYPDQTIKNLWVFPVFSNRLQKKAGGGDLLNPCEVEVSLGQTKAGLLFHMLPPCALMPYLGPARPLQGATLETDFSDLAKNGLGEK